MSALATIIDMPADGMTEMEMHSHFLDYYDHWATIDPRLAPHYDYLSRAADIFGNDLLTIATYVHEILQWIDPENIQDPRCVVSVAAMTEGILVTARCACDAVGDALAYVACEKSGQAPTDGLRGLVAWAAKNPRRVRPAVMEVLSDDLDWFWSLRSLRDFVVHQGAHPVIQCDTSQFNLWVHAQRTGWITREPLLPLLARKVQGLRALAERAGIAINGIIGMPADRVRSRVISGVYVPALYRLLNVADDYAEPSP